MGTGILLGVDGTAPTYFGFSLLMLHKLSFLAWAAAMTVHVLAYVWRLPRLIGSDLARAATAGRGLRWSVTLLGLGGGAALGLACAHLYANWHRW